VQRWATFDCYGTLIDWNAGIGAVLERLWGVEQAPRLLERYHALEPEVEAEEYRSYGEVMTLTLERIAEEVGYGIPEGESGMLAQSLPEWPPFPEVPDALRELRHRGWNLVILSNSDRRLIVESEKPAHAHWERFFELTTADKKHHVHVAASLFHDIAPARELGLRSVWINRLDEDTDPEPDRELTDLSALPDTLDELVPAP